MELTLPHPLASLHRQLLLQLPFWNSGTSDRMLIASGTQSSETAWNCCFAGEWARFSESAGIVRKGAKVSGQRWVDTWWCATLMHIRIAVVKVLLFVFTCDFVSNFLTFRRVQQSLFMLNVSFSIRIDCDRTLQLPLSWPWRWGCVFGCRLSLGYTAVSFWKPLGKCMPRHWYSQLRCDFKRF